MDLAAAQHILKTTFGYDDFRPGQQAIIEHVMAGRTAGYYAHGWWEVLCYQIPALMFDGITVVVSP